MKTVLMSFKPYVYDAIFSGSKIFEYRKHYSAEETIVYMYVSAPISEIKGILHLGKRIEFLTWKDKYSFDQDAIKRIENFSKSYNYAMPIFSYQETSSISLKELKSDLNRFIVPQSYYYIEPNSELSKYLEKNLKIISKKCENSFENALPINACISTKNSGK